MSTPIVRRRKRAVEVDTIQWLGNNIGDVIDFTGGDFLLVDPGEGLDPEITAKVYDELHSTWVGVKTGQHIVRGIVGEYYPIDETVAADTYDEVDTNFFQPGHTYLHTRLRWKFRCDAVTSHPDAGKRVAVGYSRFGHGRWQTGDLSEDIRAEGGWTDITDTTTGEPS